MEVPRLGIKLELQFMATATATATATEMPGLSLVFDLYHSSQQCQSLNPLSEARDRTRNLTVPSQIHFSCATTGTLLFFFFFFLKAELVAYGASQARSQIRATATSLRHSYSRIQAASATYMTAHGNPRSLTH